MDIATIAFIVLLRGGGDCKPTNVFITTNPGFQEHYCHDRTELIGPEVDLVKFCMQPAHERFVFDVKKRKWSTMQCEWKYKLGDAPSPEVLNRGGTIDWGNAVMGDRIDSWEIQGDNTITLESR